QGERFTLLRELLRLRTQLAGLLRRSIRALHIPGRNHLQGDFDNTIRHSASFEQRAIVGAMGKSRWGAGAIVITIAALSVAGCSSNSPDRGSEESIAQCETRIERLLKAPATADFNSTASTNGT